MLSVSNRNRESKIQDFHTLDLAFSSKNSHFSGELHNDVQAGEGIMKHFHIRLWLLVLLLGTVTAPAVSQLQIAIDSFSVQAYPKVAFKVRVTDGGSTVTGLSLPNFTIFEDGVIQAPIDGGCNDSVVSSFLSVMLIIDRSGSMDPFFGPNKLRDAQNAAKKFLDRLSNKDEAALVSFNNRVSFDQGWTSNIQLVKNEIDNLSAGGGTAIWDAVTQGVVWTRDRQKKKVIILLTDGKDNSSSTTLQQAVSAAKASDIIVFTIGLGNAAEIPESELRYLASQTGGQYYRTPNSTELDAIYQLIANQIISQGYCELWYFSKIDCLDGSEHEVEVEVNTGGDRAVATATFNVPLDSSTFSYVDVAIDRNYVVEAGEEITIPVKLTRITTNRPQTDFTFDVHFNTSLLSLESAEPAGAASGFTLASTPSATGSTLRLTGTTAIRDTGEFVILRFKAAHTFSSGKTEIEVTPPRVQQTCTVASSFNGLVTISGYCERAIIPGTSTGTDAYLSVNPNPFNPVTTINYAVPSAGPVKLEVFDVLGRRIMTLVDKVQPAGTFSLPFNGGGFSSGIYFVRLTTARTVLDRKIVLTK